MNVQRLIQVLHDTNLAIQRKQYYSKEQLRVFRRARAKANKQLKKLITPMITPESVGSIVKRIGKLQEAPMSCELNDLGFNSEGLRKIQAAFSHQFNYTVAEIFFSDTIYTLTDRLNKK